MSRQREADGSSEGAGEGNACNAVGAERKALEESEGARILVSCNAALDMKIRSYEVELGMCYACIGKGKIRRALTRHGPFVLHRARESRQTRPSINPQTPPGTYHDGASWRLCSSDPVPRVQAN